MNESVAIHDRRQTAPSSVSATWSSVTNSLLVWLVLSACLALTNLFIAVRFTAR